MIRLTDEYFIEADAYNYILCKDYGKTDKTGKRMYKALGYFGRLQELLEYWTETVIKKHLTEDKEEFTLNEAARTIRKALEDTKAIIHAAIPDTALYSANKSVSGLPESVERAL